MINENILSDIISDLVIDGYEMNGYSPDELEKYCRRLFSGARISNGYVKDEGHFIEIQFTDHEMIDIGFSGNRTESVELHGTCIVIPPAVEKIWKEWFGESCTMDSYSYFDGYVNFEGMDTETAYGKICGFLLELRPMLNKRLWTCD